MTKEEIKKLIYSYKDQIAFLEKSYKMQVGEIQKQIYNLRKLCNHEDKSYNPDPSGNNDSYYSCDICGAEGKRL